MPYNIGTQNDPIMIYAKAAGPFIDCSIRCDTRDAFLAAAVYAELMHQDAEGAYQAANGVQIDEVGPVVITAGTYNEEDVEVTPPVVDARHHVNFRLSGSALTNEDEFGVLKWQKWAMAWTFSGDPDHDKNANEDAMKLYGVSLIDPDTISSATRIWAG